MAWVDGYWNLGRKSLRMGPRPLESSAISGSVLTYPHYDHYQQGWQMHEGHWDHEDHRDHHYDDHHEDHGHH